MNFPWAMFLDLGVISAALLMATFIRARVVFFQKYLIPNALTAGFILLVFYNYLAEPVGMSSANLPAMAYHLLAISFIAMSMRKPEFTKKKGDPGIFATSVSIISQYSLQAILGLVITFIFIKTIYPDLFPAIGFFLPIGFALGPGQAVGIGENWQTMGFEGAPSVGLTFAAIGFLWACFGGVVMINFGIRKGWLEKDLADKLQARGWRSGLKKRGDELRAGFFLTTESETIDSMTYNLGVVLVVYLGAFLFLKFLGFLLGFAGQSGQELAVNLWAIHFVFAAMLALLAKQFMNLGKVDHTLDNGALTRIAGSSVDLMVSAAIGAISLTVVAAYWVPILAICTVGGLMVWTMVPWLASRIFTTFRFYRALIIYGACTGTMPTGLALLRVVDPDFKTPVATDYMYSSAVTFFIVIPFILGINLPAKAAEPGNFHFFWYAMALGGIYLTFAVISLIVVGRKRGFKKPGRIWLPEEDV